VNDVVAEGPYQEASAMAQRCLGLGNGALKERDGVPRPSIVGERSAPVMAMIASRSMWSSGRFRVDSRTPAPFEFPARRSATTAPQVNLMNPVLPVVQKFIWFSLSTFRIELDEVSGTEAIKLRTSLTEETSAVAHGRWHQGGCQGRFRPY
jgi:hypothetical protein